MLFDLLSVTLQNLHGFGRTPTTLDLTRERTVLVGPNNAGKTAALRIIHWLLNEASEDVLRVKRGRPLDEDERAIVVPARETSKQARRLTLRVRLPVGGGRERFGADADGIVLLRYDLRSNGDVYRGELHIGEARKKLKDRDPNSNQKALELRAILRDQILFLHIPSFRDADSDRFRQTVRSVYRARLEERALHKKQGRTVEAKNLDQAINKLDEVTRRLVQPLWEDVRAELPPGLARDGEFAFGASRETLLDWLIGQLAFRVSTDEHDADRVGVRNVGAGLQSVLDLALNLAESRDADRSVILAVEEPEAFLHPSAQRTFARQLLRPRPNTRLIVTTHSALVVDEAEAADVVLVKGRRFYTPSIDSGREAIHTSYMRGQGSEAMFARGVLLVEGESDALFFEALRRRLAAAPGTGPLAGELDKLRIVWTGSKTAFGPWYRLFDAYGRPSDRPIRWLAVFDADAGTAARQGLNEAGLTVPQPVVEAIGEMTTAQGEATDDEATESKRRTWRQKARKTNEAARKARLALRFLPLDLEDAVLENASEDTCRAVWNALGREPSDKPTLLRRLGSKASPGGDEAVKKPWIRGLIGQTIAPQELSTTVRHVLSDWIALVRPAAEAKKLVEEWCAPSTDAS